MLQWIQSQLGNVISALILIGIIALIIGTNISKRRRNRTCAEKGEGGGCSCGCGCADCPLKGSCH